MRQGISIEQFWARVQKTETCWLWTAGTDKDGYGKLWKERAHRASWELHYGLVPDGLMVCHHCDNPPCVRPDHLFLGTNTDNQQDAWRKGRKHVARGGECSWAKVTEADVREMCHLRGVLSQRQIAQRFGVTQRTVSDIQLGKRWTTVVRPLAVPIAGSIRGGTKLQEGDVVAIFQRACTGSTCRDLAQLYGVNPSTIARVLTRQTWQHVVVPQDLLERYAALACSRQMEVA
jgi:hypothetical protein